MRFEFSFRGLALRVGESEETLKGWIGALKSSEVFFETEWGRKFQALTIQAASGSAEAHKQLDAQIEQVIRANKAFELTTGYSSSGLQNFTKRMSDLTRMDFPEMIGAYKDLADRARAVGVEFHQFEGFFRDILTTYRMYGVTVSSVMDITEKWGEALNLGIVSTRDFVDAINLAKGAVDPNRAGTMLWFMANYAQTPEARQLAERALAQGPGGIAAIQQIMGGMDPMKMREMWDTLPEEARRSVYEQARMLGYEGPFGKELTEWMAQARKDWSTGLAGLPMEATRQFGVAGSMVGLEISKQLGTGSDFDKILTNMAITSSEAFQKMEISSYALSGASKEGVDFMGKYNEMMAQGKKVMDEQMTPMKKFQAWLNDINESLGLFNTGLRDAAEYLGVGLVGTGGLLTAQRAGLLLVRR